MDLEEKLRERPKLTHIEAPGMRYISTETMERMTRVFPPTKVPLLPPNTYLSSLTVATGRIDADSTGNRFVLTHRTRRSSLGRTDRRS
jgi:hypothetical protein